MTENSHDDEKFTDISKDEDTNEHSPMAQESEKAKGSKGSWKRLFKAMASQKIRLIIVVISTLIYTGFSIAAPFYSAGVIDLIWGNIQQARDAGQTFTIGWSSGGMQIVILLLLYLGSAAFYALQNLLMASFSENLTREFRNKVSAKLDRLRLSYYDQHKAGGIMSRATNDLDKVSEALQSGFLQLIESIALILGSLAIMISYSIELTLVFAAFMVVSLVLTKIVSGKTLKKASERQKRVGIFTGMIEESYSGRTIIKAFNRETTSSDGVHHAAQEMADASRKADFLTNVITPATSLVSDVGRIMVAVIGIMMLMDGRLTVGRFQAFFQYVNQISEPLTDMAYMVNTLQSAFASINRVYELLEEDEIVVDPAHPATLTHVDGRVDFKKVRFGYTPDELLMDGIDFEAIPGYKVAVVGATGAGKTTLVNLLMRFYEVDGGAITLDGVDTRSLTYAELRSHFGMVLQDTWLFEGTIADNICYGKADATRDEIIAAAKAARADFFIRTLPRGYDTVLKNDAENISVGQRQLLTIARVVLRNPTLLILDEATSSVDTRTETEISKAMNSLMEERTSFVIAHRLSTIVDADLILVMEKGTIIEQGTHEQLLEKGGAYADLYESQFA